MNNEGNITGLESVHYISQLFSVCNGFITRKA